MLCLIFENDFYSSKLIENKTLNWCRGPANFRPRTYAGLPIIVSITLQHWEKVVLTMSSKIKKGILHIILNKVVGDVLWWCLLCFLLWRSFFKSLWIHIFTNVSYVHDRNTHDTKNLFIFSKCSKKVVFP